MLLSAVAAVSILAVPPSPHLAAGECVVVAALGEGVDRVFGGEECDRRTLPASTFKVPHALIALDAAVVTPATVMKWDGTRYDFASWQRDHTLDTAMKSSVVWFFQRLARAIGRDRELAHLRAFEYGSRSFTREVDMFWLNGDLTISPREQVAFLKRMFSYQLPIDRRHVDAVKQAMTMPPGKLLNAAGSHAFPLAWPDVRAARLKTGNGTVAGERASWLIGEIEAGGRAYVFASRVRSTGATLDTTAGADLAVKVLNEVVPEPDRPHQNAVLDRWLHGRPAFGVYAPNENPAPRGERHAYRKFARRRRARHAGFSRAADAGTDRRRGNHDRPGGGCTLTATGGRSAS
jgi:beta-lactamase class D